LVKAVVVKLKPVDLYNVDIKRDLLKTKPLL